MLKRLSFVLLATALALGCVSKGKYNDQVTRAGDLSKMLEAEKAEKAKCKADLSAAEARIVELSAQLESMGISLQERGTEKAQLEASLAQLQLALEQYKARAAQLEAIKQRFEALQAKLKKLTDQGLTVQIRNNKMVVSLPGDVLFRSGSDKLEPKGIDFLGQVAEIIRGDETLAARYYQVAGHTDDKPLKGGAFKDNWGLSLMRSRSVLVYLVAPQGGKDGGGGLDPKRWHAAGFADTDPLVPNDTDANRGLNRRVELVIMPDISEMLDLKSLAEGGAP